MAQGERRSWPFEFDLGAIGLYDRDAAGREVGERRATTETSGYNDLGTTA